MKLEAASVPDKMWLAGNLTEMRMEYEEKFDLVDKEMEGSYSMQLKLNHTSEVSSQKGDHSGTQQCNEAEC